MKYVLGLELALREELLTSNVVRSLLWGVFFLVRCVLWPITSLGLLRRRRECPPITNPLLLRPAKDLARSIRTRQVSCSEVVQAYIERAQEVNPILNAVVQARYHDALQEAKEIDDFLASGKLSEEQLENTLPLLGVPLTVKETIAVKGMSNNAAFTLVPEHIADSDAEVVRLLREAGAIPLLVSNTPELCTNWETFNARVGTTNNPYDTRLTPAGSSGGEAALLGAAASVISLGSDIGGSLRLPAFFTCVYGHKPTPGYVCNDGHMPTATDEKWNNFFTLGPMCRYAEDLPLMLSTIIGDKKKAEELRLDHPVDISKIKVFYMEDDGPKKAYTDPVNPEIQAAMRKAVSHLHSKYGVQVKQVSIEGLQDMLVYTLFLLARMKGLPSIYQKDINNTDEWNSMTVTILKRLLCMSNSSAVCLAYGPFKKLVDSMSEENFKRLGARMEKFKNLFKEMLGEDGVFLYPPFNDVAFPHGQIYYRITNTGYLSLFNLLEMPVTACPLGLNQNKLPLGVQIAAWQKQDRLTIAVARALEQEFGGWIPPCPTLLTS